MLDSVSRLANVIMMDYCLTSQKIEIFLTCV